MEVRGNHPQQIRVTEELKGSNAPFREIQSSSFTGPRGGTKRSDKRETTGRRGGREWVGVRKEGMDFLWETGGGIFNGAVSRGGAIQLVRRRMENNKTPCKLLPPRGEQIDLLNWTGDT